MASDFLFIISASRCGGSGLTRVNSFCGACVGFIQVPWFCSQSEGRQVMLILYTVIG